MLLADWHGNKKPPFLVFKTDEKSLFLWGDFSGHWPQDIMDNAAAINVVLPKVPTRYTYVCQPADVAWNHPFKRACVDAG
ncbi:hypothetical protein JG688_00005166 [Phytophthora aleatoria]|uniref:DDE-1 domain-containing protein n=1 Tax=Phytophthora aleatoria TaxID=2496075 RepID=A0A8J5J016_9STRA|nr:hypothetical protein JG688_00005166 [Phytophthora aleatoria]